MAAKDVLGRRGEDLAARYLERQGLVILSRNWRCRHGELDLVATDADRLVVCEVKTRSGVRFGEPPDAGRLPPVDRLRRLTAHQVRWCEIRFDVLAVVAVPGRPVTVRHYEAAF